MANLPPAVTAAGAAAAAYFGYRMLTKPAPIDLKGRIALVTGAGSGVGRLAAIKFAKAGCDVVLWDISAPGLEETKAMIKKAAPQLRCWTQRVDLSDRMALYAAAEEASRLIAPSHVSILVNNAGIVSGKQLLDTPDEKIIATFEVNTFAAIWATKAFLPPMLKAKQGHIVTVASVAGLTSAPLMVDYGASKHAAVGFMDGLRKEIRVVHGPEVKASVVCPAHIKTGLFKGFKQPLVPSLEPQQVADAIVDVVQRPRAMEILPKMADPRSAHALFSPEANDAIARALGMGGMMKGVDLSHAEERLGMMDAKKAKL